jgi:hypothetical protein
MEHNDRLVQVAAVAGGMVGVAEIFGWPDWPFFKDHIPAITLILIGALLEAQEEESLAEVRREVIAGARQYRSEQGGLAIPMEAVLVCGSKR